MVRNYILKAKLRMEREKFESLRVKFLAAKILNQGDEEKRFNQLINQKRKMEKMVDYEFQGLSKREIQTQYDQEEIEKLLEYPKEIMPYLSDYDETHNKIGA